ncbi:aldo/keto reductase [Auraticoccus monumenti]|uniref:Aldo/keto reductase n=1 Tax=Auraticoccus monumenti TaxID=675864 RepID=A0A1G6ZGJ8_9ACTN|nr:aldo/keto reductase [Auraticoccus monumenti]SDE01591.1 Aldo/keto reductase [Auraticoccus monumenti]
MSGEGPGTATATLARTVTLRGGVTVPQLGLGVFQVPDEDAQRVVEQALELGYRHIDTATAYVNEPGVGAAIAASGLPREEVFVTSKLRNGDQGAETALRAYEQSCRLLGLDALDLYLIHWPNPAAGLWQASWRSLEMLHQRGQVRAIGVSNFMPEHLAELAATADELPAVNQVELHPTFQQADVVAACRQHDIVVEGYSPLGQGADLEAPAVIGAAAELGVTPAQVVLAWHLRRGHVIIPKTVSPTRMRENSSLDDVELSDEQVAAIDALEAGRRIFSDPRTFSLSQIR